MRGLLSNPSAVPGEAFRRLVVSTRPGGSGALARRAGLPDRKRGMHSRSLRRLHGRSFRHVLQRRSIAAQQAKTNDAIGAVFRSGPDSETALRAWTLLSADSGCGGNGSSRSPTRSARGRSGAAPAIPWPAAARRPGQCGDAANGAEPTRAPGKPEHCRVKLNFKESVSPAHPSPRGRMRRLSEDDRACRQISAITRHEFMASSQGGQDRPVPVAAVFAFARLK